MCIYIRIMCIYIYSQSTYPLLDNFNIYLSQIFLQTILNLSPSMCLPQNGKPKIGHPQNHHVYVWDSNHPQQVHGRFPKQNYLQIIHLNKSVHYKPSILG